MKQVTRQSAILLMFLINSIAYSDCDINTALLKYNRELSVKFAKENWYKTADGFVNYGPSHLEVLTQEKIEELKIEIDSNIYKECNDRLKVSGKCPGDCANFISQCLIAGRIGFKELTKGIKYPSIIQRNGIRTVANAGELSNRLLKMCVYSSENKCWKDVNGTSLPISLEMLEPGDVVFGKGPGASTRHPYLVGEKPRFVSKGEGYLNYTGFYSHSFSIDTADTTTLIEPLTLFHFPNVTMVKEVEVYVESQNDSRKKYYHAKFDETKNNGDGMIIRNVWSPISIISFSNKENPAGSVLIFRIELTKPINTSHKKNRIRMLQDKHYKKANHNLDIVELSPLVYSSDKRIVSFVLTNKQISVLKPSIYFLEIQLYSNDNTPINGTGTYRKYTASPDTNHKISFY